jgi:hypothetical protein
MATDNKDTIYVDIDDEITTIIDKLRGSNGKIVALVLPKRAAVFQSIVNMKLLKRSADDAKKHLVLITSEAGLLPLAGMAGVHVAKTLNSKPEIPLAPTSDDAEESVDETPEEVPVAETAAEQPIGALAGIPATPAADGEDMETLELDDDELPEDVATAVAPKSFEPPKKDKKLAVPNFDRFRTLLLIGGLALILLIVGLIFALKVLPKATITVKTNGQSLNVQQDLKLSTTAKELDLSDNTLPAKLASQQKTFTQQVTATGQQNNGNKAAGSATISLTNCSHDTVTIPAGTGLSGSGQTYITQSSVTLNSVKVGSNCNPSSLASFWSGSVNVVAARAGAGYNIPSGTSMSVASGSDYSSSDLKATSGSISGGTDDIVTVVSQADINKAKAQINASDGAVKQKLQEDLKSDDYYPITSTFSSGTPATTTSANVGDKASNVSVTEVITYTMFGVREQDLKTVVDNAVKDQIDTSKQSILSEGLDKATFAVNSSSATAAQLSMQTTAVAGPDIDINGIKQAAKGKKPGDIKAQLNGNPGITSVDVKLSPFWVGSVPKKTSKITVVIAKPPVKASSSND